MSVPAESAGASKTVTAASLFLVSVAMVQPLANPIKNVNKESAAPQRMSTAKPFGVVEIRLILENV